MPCGLASLEAVVDVLFDTVVVVVDICCEGPCVLGKLTLGGAVVVASWVDPGVIGRLFSVKDVLEVFSMISFVVVRQDTVETVFFVDVFIVTSFVS